MGSGVLSNGRFYRGGRTTGAPRGMTAADVIAYERDDLGNTLQVTPGVSLSEIDASRLMWVARTREEADEYDDEVFEVNLAAYRIIAQDPYGGLLVERLLAPEASRVRRAMRMGMEGNHGFS